MPEAPDGRARAASVLAGSYAPASAVGIRRFRLDVECREFRPIAGRSGVPFPAYLARAAVSGTYFVVSETTACAAAGPGTNAAQTGLPGTVWALGPDPAARDPGVSARAVGPDGALAGLADRREHAGRGPVRSRQDCTHVHSTMFTGAGDRLIAADLGADVLVVYDFDARDEQLNVVSATSVPPGWGPRYMLPGPGERTLLVVGQLASELGIFAFELGVFAFELGVFAFDEDKLELITRVSTTGSRRDGMLAADIHASPDGRRVFESNRGPVNTIATFDTTLPHQPELIGETASDGTWPRHFAVAPDGRFLVVANEHSGQPTALAVDPDGAAGAPLASVAMPDVSYVEVEAT